MMTSSVDTKPEELAHPVLDAQSHDAIAERKDPVDALPLTPTSTPLPVPGFGSERKNPEPTDEDDDDTVTPHNRMSPVIEGLVSAVAAVASIAALQRTFG